MGIYLKPAIHSYIHSILFLLLLLTQTLLLSGWLEWMISYLTLLILLVYFQESYYWLEKIFLRLKSWYYTKQLLHYFMFCCGLFGLVYLWKKQKSFFPFASFSLSWSCCKTRVGGDVHNELFQLTIYITIRERVKFSVSWVLDFNETKKTLII